jgi:hypothetical protein
LSDDAILAGTRFRSTKTGRVRLELTAPEDTPVWIDGKPVLHTDFILTDLSAGEHVIVLKFDRTKTPKSFRLRSDDGTFLGSPR